jgi:outer membrane protein TolC
MNRPHTEPMWPDSLRADMARVVLERVLVRARWLAVLTVVGCVPSHSAVFGPVDREAQRRIGVDVSWGGASATTDVAIVQLLAKPIDLDGAVRIAIARNQRLQASYEELGIAASRVAEATVLPPTVVDFDYKHAFSGTVSETELAVVQDVLDLIQIGQRRGAANSELDAARARAISVTVDLAARVEIAFNDHTAAKQELELVQTALDAATASADLAERQHAAGNTTNLALAREHEQRERLRVDASRAQQDVADTRARLGALLGVGADQRAWVTIGRLADAPAAPPKLDDLGGEATTANLDVVALRADADAARARHGYATVRAFIPMLGAGIDVGREYVDALRRYWNAVAAAKALRRGGHVEATR